MFSIEFLRQFRLGGYAIFDFIVSFFGIYLLSPWLSKTFLKFRLSVPKQSWLWLTLPLSILVHLFSGNITLMTRNFIDLHNHYFLKAVILGLFIWGIKDIKVVRK
jgi:hypothetical protein